MRATLDVLLKQGWVDSQHKYSDYMILLHGNDRLLYDAKQERIISKYAVRDIQEHETMGVGACDNTTIQRLRAQC